MKNGHMSVEEEERMMDEEELETPTTNHSAGFVIGCFASSLFWIALGFVVVAIMAR